MPPPIEFFSGRLAGNGGSEASSEAQGLMEGYSVPSSGQSVVRDGDRASGGTELFCKNWTSNEDGHGICCPDCALHPQFKSVMPHSYFKSVEVCVCQEGYRMFGSPPLGGCPFIALCWHHS